LTGKTVVIFKMYWNSISPALTLQNSIKRYHNSKLPVLSNIKFKASKPEYVVSCSKYKTVNNNPIVQAISCFFKTQAVKPSPLGIFFIGLFLCVLLPVEPAYAYIGPGAGFAFLGSFFVLLTTLSLSLFTILSWPLRFALIYWRRRKSYKNSQVDRVVVVGLDGMDFHITQEMLTKGELPNLKRLAENGTFSPLQTTTPPISPVAWSSFITGTNPGKHNIFDFLTRDPKSYLPDLASAKVEQKNKTLKIGKYAIPLGKPLIRILRKSRPFWSVLSDNGIFSTIIRVPITFPPDQFYGLQLSAMGVPDLRGTQGSFTYFTDDPGLYQKYTGGEVQKVTPVDGGFEGSLAGPPNPISQKGEELVLPFRFTIEADGGNFSIGGTEVRLEPGKYSEWLKLPFKAGPGVTLQGIARFYLISTKPHFKLYVTPLNIDPEKPAMPISHPSVYADYLAKKIGPYSTLGLAEDTWALNEGLVSHEMFEIQADDIFNERKKMLFHSLEQSRKGAVVCVFDTTDRVQHMFFRFLRAGDTASPEDQKRGRKIADTYKKMDTMIGELLERISERDALVILSDHGFESFDRQVNLNNWLLENGYLVVKEDSTTANDEENREVDWSKTKAYAMGLNGLFLNILDRESQGCIAAGAEAQALKDELIKRLTHLTDPGRDENPITEVFDSAKQYQGPYTSNAPDLIIGYNRGFRSSWNAVLGQLDKTVFEDNVKNWSGDHCIHPKWVPGVLFSNRKLANQSASSRKPGIWDVPTTILHWFGIDRPAYMDGRSLL